MANPVRFFNEVKPVLGDSFALFAGLIMPLGFAPFEWRAVPYVSLALLLLLLKTRSARRAYLRGFLFGLGMFGLGVSWVYNSMHDFGGASVPVATLLAAGMVVLNAVFIGVPGYLLQRWSLVRDEKSGLIGDVYCNLLVFPSAWVFIEWVRSWIFTGFPWLLVGYSQVDTWLGGYAPVGGALTVSFMVAVAAGAVVTVITGKGFYRQAAAGIVIFVMGLGWMLGLVHWTEPMGNSIQASLVQGNIPQDVKLKPENLTAGLNHYYQLTRPHYDSRVIIWPETAIPTFRHRIRDFLQPLSRELNEHDTDLLTGGFIYDFETKRYYNSVFKVGDEEGVYHKKHLVPFGEYMPLRGLLAFLNNFIRIPMSDIAAGDGSQSLRLAGYDAAASICYESAYPDVYRDQLPDAAFLVNVSNDAWFGNSLAPHQHLEIARMRALEAGRYLLRSTNTGISAIIGPQGRVIARSPQFEVDVLTGHIQPMQGLTPFIWSGRTPVVLILALILGATEWRSRRLKTAK